MRLRSLILFLLFVFVSVPAMAAGTEEEKELGFWVEVQTISRQPARAILWYEKELTDSFGFFTFVWRESDGFRQLLAGPTWKPFEGLQLGIGIGRETVREEGRGVSRGFFLDATRGDWNLSAAFERGRVSGPWHKVTATYAFSKAFGAGLMSEKDLGFGPRFEWNARKDFQVWGAMLRGRFTDVEDDIAKKRTTTVFGVNFSF
ncbi:hypothetical protein HY415_00490 [Candidatus Kaiserbacteria bacterium]|nr:hypothetical protein [Candidatus Kaiserbacteria bacterium]